MLIVIKTQPKNEDKNSFCGNIFVNRKNFININVNRYFDLLILSQ